MPVYSHNPYVFEAVPKKKIAFMLPIDEIEAAVGGLSDGDVSEFEEEAPWGREDSTLELADQIPFYKYDPGFLSVNADALPLMSCVRLFAGQLPYNMPPSAVAWLVWVTTGVHVVSVEKIVRWSNKCQPCGCFHVYCFPQDEGRVLAANEVALIDKDGVWVARSAQQVGELLAFCRTLELSPELRAPGLPYRMITLQPARSTRGGHTNNGGTIRQQQQVGEMEVRVTLPPPYSAHQ